jgi:hypothetical protein
MPDTPSSNSRRDLRCHVVTAPDGLPAIIYRSDAEYIAVLEAEVERLEMEISEKSAWIERDRREPDKTLLNVASLRRALQVQS